MDTQIDINLIIIAVIAGVVIGVVFGIIQSVRNTRKRKPDNPVQAMKSWSELQEKQVTLDVLTSGDIVNWTETCRAETGESRQMFLVKANRTWVERLGYVYPAAVDPEKNIIAFMGDTDDGEVSHIRLFCFGEIDDRIAEKFNNGDVVYIQS